MINSYAPIKENKTSADNRLMPVAEYGAAVIAALATAVEIEDVIIDHVAESTIQRHVKKKANTLEKFDAEYGQKDGNAFYSKADTVTFNVNPFGLDETANNIRIITGKTVTLNQARHEIVTQSLEPSTTEKFMDNATIIGGVGLTSLAAGLAVWSLQRKLASVFDRKMS